MAEERISFLTMESMPSACRTFFAWCTAIRLNEL